MPIYEYQCGSCEHQFETIQRISEAPLEECPECGDTSLRKLISPVAFRLKGGGWYETDFKKGDARNIVASDSSKEDSKPTSETTANGASKNSDSGDKSKSSPSESAGATSKPASTAAGTNE